MNINNKKSLFREYILKNSLKNRVNNYKKDKVLNKEITEYILKNRFKNIMAYIPLKREVNISPLIKELRQKGINLYIPFMEGKSFRLVKYRLPLEVKKFNIKEAKVSNVKVKNIDLAIVPILGVDINFKRIGFGKGMYDRFFEKNSKIVKKVIFIERDLYICTTNITDKFDISAECIFTTKCNFIKI